MEIWINRTSQDGVGLQNGFVERTVGGGKDCADGGAGVACLVDGGVKNTPSFSIRRFEIKPWAVGCFSVFRRPCH